MERGRGKTVSIQEKHSRLISSFREESQDGGERGKKKEQRAIVVQALPFPPPQSNGSEKTRRKRGGRILLNRERLFSEAKEKKPSLVRKEPTS